MIFLAKLVGLGWKVTKKRTRLIEIPGVLSDFLKSTRFICFSTILSGYLQTNIHPFRLMKLRSKFFSKVLFLLIYIPWVHTFFYPECIHFFFLFLTCLYFICIFDTYYFKVVYDTFPYTTLVRYSEFHVGGYSAIFN